MIRRMLTSALVLLAVSQAAAAQTVPSEEPVQVPNAQTPAPQSRATGGRRRRAIGARRT